MIKKTSETRALAGNIVNAYNDSQTSAYSTDFINGTVLYEPSTPTTDTNIALSSSAANYRYLEVFYYRSADGSTSKTYGNLKLSNPDGKRLNASILMADGAQWYMYGSRYDINGTSLTFLNGGHAQSSLTPTSGSQIYIEKIIGYK